LLIVYICLALGAWSASAGISFSQSNRDTNQTRRDNTIIQHKSEKTVDDSDQGSPVIASYYKDGKKRRKRVLLLMRLSFQRNKKQLKN
ncbi:RND efflux system, outer membrane lipoprotein, NodT family, partial [human gut metagenome]